MKRVAAVFTGGTISMRRDPLAGGNVPSLSGAEVLALTEGIGGLAEIRPIDLGLTPASHFTFPALFELWASIRGAIADGADGVVVVQGTDTIEETAFFLDLLHAGPQPVVVTGAMRTSEAPDFDGAANLRGAIRCAAADELRDQGVLVSLAGSIDQADDVTKTHTSALDAFHSLNVGLLGRVGDQGVEVLRRRSGRRHVHAVRAAERVHLITATVAMDETLLDAAREAGADGFVVEATGEGNTSAGLLESATRAIHSGLPVVLATRCAAGSPSDAYAFPGGGATWVRAGAILAGTLSGPKARVLLAVGLGAGLERDALRALFAAAPPTSAIVGGA